MKKKLFTITNMTTKEQVILQTTKSDTLITETMGMIAFAKGIKCAPALDPELNKFLFREGQSHKRLIAEMTAWTRGWHKANLA